MQSLLWSESLSRSFLTFPKDDFSEHLCASSPYAS